jgi:hypothetical protein
MIKIEHNVETGEVKEVEMTAEEVAIFEARAQEIASATSAIVEAKAQKAAEEAARLSAKLAIYAKLGLTEEEINTLIS